MANKKTPIDWASIKADWLKSDMSIRRLGEWYQVSEAAIRKKAVQEAWGARAQTKSAHKKTAHQPDAHQAQAAPIDPTDPEQIVGRGHNLIFRLLDELDATTTHAGRLAELIEIHEKDPRSKAAMLKAIELKGRAEVIKALATAFKTWNESKAPEGKKAQRQAAAEAVAASGNKFAPRSGPRLAVSNG